MLRSKHTHTHGVRRGHAMEQSTQTISVSSDLSPVALSMCRRTRSWYIRQYCTVARTHKGSNLQVNGSCAAVDVAVVFCRGLSAEMNMTEYIKYLPYAVCGKYCGQPTMHLVGQMACPTARQLPTAACETRCIQYGNQSQQGSLIYHIIMPCP